MEAVSMLICDRFADRHAAIEQGEAEKDAQKDAAVSTGDLTRDAVTQQDRGHSRQIQQMVDEVVSDGQVLLRQWLCDGDLQAFYHDPLSGSENIIAASAWELPLTDKAINGGDYHPLGDSKSGGPVRLLRRDVERVLHGRPEPRLPAVQDATADPLAEGRGHNDTSPTADDRQALNILLPVIASVDEPPALTKPSGRDRKSAGVRIALKNLYGPGLGREVKPNERASAVLDWIRQKRWEEPGDPERTILDVLNPRKRK
jgi:hypothetical protein